MQNTPSATDYLLSQSIDAICILNFDGEVITANENFALLTGKSTWHLSGQSIATLFCDQNEILNDILKERVLKEKDSNSFNSNFINLDGSITSLYWHIECFNEGKIVKAVKLTANIREGIRSRQDLAIIANNISDCFFILDKNFNIIFQNTAAVTKFSHSDFNDDTNIFFASFCEDTNHKFVVHFENAFKSEIPLRFVEFSALLNCWFSIDVIGLNDELNILVNDISARIVDHKINELEIRTFEMNIAKEKPFQEVMMSLLRGFEVLYPNLDSSILSVEHERVWHIASPKLPEDYSNAINGVKIGIGIGSCGTSAFLKKNIISESIERDENWINFKKLITPYGYQACWSFPIISKKHLDVMATFALYSRESRKPTENEFKSIARIANIIQIIFEDQKQDDTLLRVNNRYEMVTKATNDAIYDWSLKSNQVFWSENLYNIFGFTPQEADQNSHWWLNHIHPEDKLETIKSLKACLRKKKTRWDAAYKMLVKNGSYKHVYNRGHIIYNEEGKALSIIGAIQDVSVLKEREIEILKQNNKLKEIAQISSHELRRPVTSILGLVSLFNTEDLSDENNRMVIAYLEQATQELDDVIHTIVAKTLEADHTIYNKAVKRGKLKGKGPRVKAGKVEG